MKRTIHLVCHAHVDPVWLWDWEEGLSETLSTFRLVTEFCEDNPEFIFNMNESLLYRWIERYDPPLFKRIKKLVKSKQWNILGGAYLQPDINAPSGESHIRQYLIGRNYFRKHFGVQPETAFNVDSFGQAEGFQQILAGCGIKNYVFSRPTPTGVELPMDAFLWRDRSGSEVTCLRSYFGYQTRGKVKKKYDLSIKAHDKNIDYILMWGFGNHGGGPTRKEYAVIKKMMKKNPELANSTPESYFKNYCESQEALPVVSGELQNASPGCYTSFARVKRAHREAEGRINSAERLATIAMMRGDCPYPQEEFNDAWREILFGEFHDILPGTCLPSAEKDTLDLFGLVNEKLKRTRTWIMVNLLKDEPESGKQTVSLFVFNPHGFQADADIVFYFTHAHASTTPGSIRWKVVCDGKTLPTQRERGQDNNGNSDLSLHGSTHVSLPPFSVRRLELKWYKIRKPALPQYPKTSKSSLTMKSDKLRVSINPRTGLVDFAGPAGARKSFLGKNALRPVMFKDVAHSWFIGSPDNIPRVRRGEFGKKITTPWVKVPDAKFKLATIKEATRICGGMHKHDPIEPVHIIEDGPVRRVVEAIFICERSTLIRHYIFSYHLNWFEIRDRVLWNESNTMLKVHVPLAFKPEKTISETPYSAITRPTPKLGFESSNQRWVKAIEEKDGRWVGVVNNSSHGNHILGRDLYVNELRSPAYASGYMIGNESKLLDRYVRRHDQGEHEFRFGFLFGEGPEVTPIIRAAGIVNIDPIYLAHYPGGKGKPKRVTQAKPFVTVEPDNVEIVALKKAENSKEIVVRLMEHEGKATKCKLRFSNPRGTITVPIEPYKLKTLLIKTSGGKFKYRETNLVEEKLEASQSTAKPQKALSSYKPTAQKDALKEAAEFY